MPKKILLIENDQPLAGRVSESLEATGYQVRATGDGREGLDLARDWAPEAIVLCVELPSMSGYLVCQKLKKDEALKAIPLVLTSAEATEETFEKHRTLKARADDYLLKPYEPAALVEKLGALVGFPDPVEIPEAPADDAEEEVVSLEAEIGLEVAEGEPDAEVPGLSLEALPDEPPLAVNAEAGLDEDLRLLDDAFDGIAAVPAPQEAAAALDELTGETSMSGDEVDAAAASLLDEDEEAAGPDLAALEADADAALGALDGPDEAPALLVEPRGLHLAASASEGAPSEAGTSAAALREAREALEGAREELAERDAQLRELRREVAELSDRAEEAVAELAQANTRAEAAQERARRADVEAKAGRDEARRAADQARAAEAEVSELRRKIGEAERRAAEASSRADGLERETEELRTELVVARGEADGARGEVERRTAELKKRVAELEATNAKNEERVVKAYQKIKADEKVRDKVRKALAIATQLLDEGLVQESAAEKERRAAAAGRE